MIKTIRSWLIASLQPLAVYYAYRSRWPPMMEHPILAIMLAGLCTAAVLIVGFGRKVWEKRLEERAIQAAGDGILTLCHWVVAWGKNLAPGFRRRYNRRMKLEHEIFNVRGLGLVNNFTIELTDVFVDLKIHPSSRRPQTTADPLARSIPTRDATREAQTIGQIWDFLRARWKSRTQTPTAMVVVGAPGSGKTTLLQHIAVTLATNGQRRYRFGSAIPLLLFLRDHISAIWENPGLTLGELTQLYVNKKFGTLKAPAGWFEQKLSAGECVVLLDGLDEVADAEKRRALSKWVDRQVLNYARCIFVLTSRPLGYEAAPLKRGDKLEVQSFNPEQVRKFVKQWYLANEIKSSGNRLDEGVRLRAERDSEDLLWRLSRTPNLNALTVNPLLLTMVAMVHRYHGALPGSRVELYGEICEALLGRWRQAIGIQDPIKSSQKRLVLATLASTMMRRQSAEIVTGEAVQAIAMPLDNIGQAGISGESFLNDLREASGLLQEREASRWSFVHLSFQEFLAADYWLKNKQAEPNWSKMVGDSWWHETLRLYAAQDDATPIVRACLDAERSAGVSDKQKIAALMLAADCFEEATLLNADLRREVEERIVAALESADEALRRRAAEAHLSRRLNSLYPLDDDRAVDVDYLTSAEYQLFLDDMRARGRYHQPEHWTGFTFLPGQARQPVLGVRGEDAQAFCDWLTQRQGGKMLYGLPSRVEATALPSAKTGPLATWRRDGHGFNLTPLPESTEQEIRQRLLSFSTAKLPLHSQLPDGLDRAFTGDFSLTLTRDLTSATPQDFAHFRGLASRLVRDLARVLDLTHDLVLSRALARARDQAHDLALDLAGDLVRALNFDYAHERASALVRVLAVTKDLPRAHSLASNLVLVIAHARDLSACDRDRTIDRARDLACDLAIALDRASDRAHDRANDRIGKLTRNLTRALAHNLARNLARTRDHAPTPIHSIVRDLDLTRALIPARDQAHGLAHHLDGACDPAGARDLACKLACDLGRILVYDLDTLSGLALLSALPASLLATLTAGTATEYHQSQRRYMTLLTEYAYSVQAESRGTSWWQRWRRTRPKAEAPEPLLTLSGYYWWLQIVMAREAGVLNAWEGIRIVRRSAESPIDSTAVDQANDTDGGDEASRSNSTSDRWRSKCKAQALSLPLLHESRILFLSSFIRKSRRKRRRRAQWSGFPFSVDRLCPESPGRGGDGRHQQRHNARQRPTLFQKGVFHWFAPQAFRLVFAADGITAAVTGPPPKHFDFKTRVIGGSGSPLV